MPQSNEPGGTDQRAPKVYSTTSFLRAAFLWEATRIQPEFVVSPDANLVAFVWREQLPLALLLEDVRVQAPDGTAAAVNMQKVESKLYFLKRRAFQLLDKEKKAK